jgi:hypothetical protein
MRAGPPCKICELLAAWKDWIYDRLKPPPKQEVEIARLEPIPQQTSRPIPELPRPDYERIGEPSILDVCRLLDITLDEDGRGTCPLCNHPKDIRLLVTREARVVVAAVMGTGNLGGKPEMWLGLRLTAFYPRAALGRR